MLKKKKRSQAVAMLPVDHVWPLEQQMSQQLIDLSKNIIYVMWDIYTIRQDEVREEEKKKNHTSQDQEEPVGNCKRGNKCIHQH